MRVRGLSAEGEYDAEVVADQDPPKEGIMKRRYKKYPRIHVCQVRASLFPWRGLKIWRVRGIYWPGHSGTVLFESLKVEDAWAHVRYLQKSNSPARLKIIS